MIQHQRSGFSHAPLKPISLTLGACGSVFQKSCSAEHRRQESQGKRSKPRVSGKGKTSKDRRKKRRTDKNTAQYTCTLQVLVRDTSKITKSFKEKRWTAVMREKQPTEQHKRNTSFTSNNKQHNIMSTNEHHNEWTSAQAVKEWRRQSKRSVPKRSHKESFKKTTLLAPKTN